MCPPSERIYAKMRQGWFNSYDPNIFVTNRCRANPNTSPDSPLGVWICSTPICHKATGPCSDRLPLVQLGVICVQTVCASGILCIQQVGIIWRQMQQRVTQADTFNLIRHYITPRNQYSLKLKSLLFLLIRGWHPCNSFLKCGYFIHPQLTLVSCGWMK